MKSSSIAVVIVIAIIAVGGFLFFASSPDQADNQPRTTTTELLSAEENQDSEPQPTQQTTLSEYTAAEVATHTTREDCWTIINGNVYDITSYIPRHSGGDNILSACGVDATSFFNGKQPGQLGGVNNHQSSSTALAELSRLQIGTLTQ